MDHDRFQSCIEACLAMRRAVRSLRRSVPAGARRRRTGRMRSAEPGLREFCRTAAAFMHRESHLSAEICRVCAEICDVCAAECERHHHEHCQLCAQECHACGEECRRMTMAMILQLAARTKTEDDKSSALARPGEQPDAVAVGIGGVGLAQAFGVALGMRDRPRRPLAAAPITVRTSFTSKARLIRVRRLAGRCRAPTAPAGCRRPPTAHSRRRPCAPARAGPARRDTTRPARCQFVGAQLDAVQPGPVVATEISGHPTIPAQKLACCPVAEACHAAAAAGRRAGS